MTLKTPLHACHVALGARMTSFAGWELPLEYRSQIEEHHAVRRDAGAFDVSHMCIVDLSGANVCSFLRQLLCNDVGRLTSGRALYTCMLRHDGHILDDMIVYFITDSWFRMVANAATRAKDLAWIREHSSAHGVEIRERVDLAMIATQGPRAREKAARALTPQERMKALAVGNFQATFCGDLFVAGTGYTGEDGWEIMVPAERAVGLWNALLEAGIAPIGLGARDTLRVESGMKLYGADMDESSHPLESGLGWTIAWEPRDRDFIGRAALETIRLAGSRFELVGLVLEARGVLRAHQHVVVRGVDSVGARVTSGTFAPTLGRSIGLARVPVGVRGEVAVEIRGKLLPARIVSPPFVRRGQILV